MFRFFRLKSRFDNINPPHIATFIASIGIKTRQLHLFTQALRHKSIYDCIDQNNERLEFLGDAILDAVIAEILFDKFPDHDEGFLTQIRSRIVNRSSLNHLGMSLGLDSIIQAKTSREIKDTSLVGNALEALIGAIYRDKGYCYTYRFVQNKIIAPHIDFDDILHLEIDSKSRIIEFGQKKRIKIYFETVYSDPSEPDSFKCNVIVDEKRIAQSFGLSKKKAEQSAAAIALSRIEA